MPFIPFTQSADGTCFVVVHICSNSLVVCLQEPQYRAAFQRLSEGATVLSRQVLQDIVQAGTGPYENKAGLIG